MNKIEYEEIRKNREKHKISDNQYKCPICCKLFSVKGFIVHVLKRHVNFDNGIKNSGGHNGHYDNPDFLKKISQKSQQHCDKKWGIKIKKKVFCFRCNKEFEVFEREKDRKEKYFCSRSCANTRIMTNEIKKKISEKNKIVIRKKFLEDKEYSAKIAKNNANNKFFTSKNERLIRDFIIKNNPDDEWTFGGGLKCGKYLISRDLFSKKLKICFEYDGCVHFKDIWGQLKDKQNKDASYENWCKENGWKLVRVSENWFLKHKKNLRLIEYILYNVKKSITKLGEEYHS